MNEGKTIIKKYGLSKEGKVRKKMKKIQKK